MRWLAAIALVAVPALALAHASAHSREAVLYLKDEGIIVKLVYVADRKESDDYRRLFDRDRDGRLTGAEITMAQDFLERRARGSFRLELDGGAVALTRVTAESRGLDDPKASITTGVFLRAPLPKKEQFRLSMTDGGDATGHLPLSVVAEGFSATFDGLSRREGPACAPEFVLPANYRAEAVVRRKSSK